MNTATRDGLKDRLIEAWNEQDVDAVVNCYTEDLVYRDPNTRGPVEGADAMRRYLTKLFGRWQMHWTVKETLSLDDADGVVGLWRASFRLPGREETVETDGMDLVLIVGDRVKRNEVYFDRAVLAGLLSDRRAQPSTRKP
jgi:ketosteroid isomerase-like protein